MNVLAVFCWAVAGSKRLELHRSGIKTFAMIAPMLPRAESLVKMLEGSVDHVLVDRMNYHYADAVYKKFGLEAKLAEGFAGRARRSGRIVSARGSPARWFSSFEV